MCFVWIWEQTAIISLYNINWLIFITETECLLRGTDWMFMYYLDYFHASELSLVFKNVAHTGRLHVVTRARNKTEWEAVVPLHTVDRVCV